MPKLCVMPGDGIGQEVIPAAVQVMQAVLPALEIVEADAGWATFERTGASVPDETLATIRDCGAGLFGAVQSPSHKVEGYRSAILTMRQSLGLYANIRPVRCLPNVSPRDDIDMIVVRENSEGLYSQRETSDGETAIAERVITRTASERIGRKSAELMQTLNRQKLTIVHKANVLPLTDGLFRDAVRAVITDKVASGEIEVDELLVDVAALKLLEDPTRFDVIVTTNLFGDILSDAAAHWGGGLGYAPSLNWGDNCAVAEPVHGSAPDIAGQGIANPIAAILSGAMLVRYVWNDLASAEQIENAIDQVLRTQPELLVRSEGATKRITRAILDSL
ncbi:MAG: isocitrate/isopropylmalate dehydrogenase family protein [Candidatus Promineifilaceae bacterium]